MSPYLFESGGHESGIRVFQFVRWFELQSKTRRAVLHVQSVHICVNFASLSSCFTVFAWASPTHSETRDAECHTCTLDYGLNRGLLNRGLCAAEAVPLTQRTPPVSACLRHAASRTYIHAPHLATVITSLHVMWGLWVICPQSYSRILPTSSFHVRSHYTAEDRRTAAGGSRHLHGTDCHANRPRSTNLQFTRLTHNFPVDPQV